MKKPDVGVIFDNRIPKDFFKEFEEETRTKNFSLILNPREPTGPMACLEWFMVPIIGAFIAKSYFDGFLKEMGKDHYQILKQNLSQLTTKAMNTPRIEPTLLGTDGKLSTNNPFSLAFSILGESGEGFIFKLLIPKATKEIDYGLIASSFMDFLSDYHLGLQSLTSIGFPTETDQLLPHTVFVHYDFDTHSIRWLNEQDYR